MDADTSLPTQGRRPKVLHLMRSDTRSGAGRGALWLHQALLSAGVDSVLLCDQPETNVSQAIYSFRDFPVRNFTMRVLGRMDAKLTPKTREATLFSPGRFGLNLKPFVDHFQPDVVNLHWVNGGLIDVETIARVDVPIVWTLRDMWPFTGGCHYSLACSGYRTGCGKCPLVGSHVEHDFTYRSQKRKASAYAKANLHFVSISNWLAGEAEASIAISNQSLDVIPNTYDPKTFYPQDKILARRDLGIPSDSIIFGGGATSHSDFYKGFDLFWKALSEPDLARSTVLTFGKDAQSHGDRHIDFSMVKDDDLLRKIYAACDAFIVPSRQEAFGKTALEALACGTPVIAFRGTGVADIVDHGKTGYLVEQVTARALGEAMRTFAALPHDQRRAMSDASGLRARQAFSPAAIADSYKDLYERVSQTSRAPRPPNKY